MAPHTPRSILVIDDEPGIVHALTRLLQRDGYVVETAGNGRDGLAALQAQHYDVILCDLRMPELDGRAFYAHVRQRAPALCQRVIFLTGDSSAADHQAFLTQCGRPWLDKPCSTAAIRRAIAQVLERVMRAQQLSHKCRELRQRSQTLLGNVQTLYAQSAHLRGQAALLRGVGKHHGWPGRPSPCLPSRRRGLPHAPEESRQEGMRRRQRGSRKSDRERGTPAPGAL